jgi:ketosteroid isomerase-like protein
VDVRGHGLTVATAGGAAFGRAYDQSAPRGIQESMTTREIVTAYIQAIEAHDTDTAARLMHPDVELTTHPNRLLPAGRCSSAAEMRAQGERGKQLMASERYDIRQMIVEGDRAAAQIAWSGTLAVALGSLPAGHVMQAQICSIIELKDGKVWRQEQYDCFA